MATLLNYFYVRNNPVAANRNNADPNDPRQIELENRFEVLAKDYATDSKIFDVSYALRNFIIALDIEETKYTPRTPTFLSLIAKLGANYRRDIGFASPLNAYDISNSGVASLFTAGNIVKSISELYMEKQPNTIVNDLLSMTVIRSDASGNLTLSKIFPNVAAIDAAFVSGNTFPKSSNWGSLSPPITTMVTDASGAALLQSTTYNATYSNGTDPSGTSILRRTQAFSRYCTSLGLPTPPNYPPFGSATPYDINIVFPFTATIIADVSGRALNVDASSNPQPVFDFVFLINQGVDIALISQYTNTRLTLAALTANDAEFVLPVLNPTASLTSYAPNFRVALRLGYTPAQILGYLASVPSLYTSEILSDFQSVVSLNWTNITDTFVVDASGTTGNRLSILRPASNSIANIEKTLLPSDNIWTVAQAIRDISLSEVRTITATILDLSGVNQLYLRAFPILTRLVQDMSGTANAFGTKINYTNVDPTIFAPLFKYSPSTRLITQTTNSTFYTVANFLPTVGVETTVLNKSVLSNTSPTESSVDPNVYALLRAIVAPFGSTEMLNYKIANLTANNTPSADSNFYNILSSSGKDYTIAQVFDLSASLPGSWSNGITTPQLLFNLVGSADASGNFVDRAFPYIPEFIKWNDISGNALKTQVVSDVSANLAANNTAFGRLLDYGVSSDKLWNIMGTTEARRALHLLPSGVGVNASQGMLSKISYFGVNVDLLNVFKLMRKLPMASYVSAGAGAGRMNTTQGATLLNNWILAFADQFPQPQSADSAGAMLALYRQLPLAGFTFGECLTYNRTMTRYVGGQLASTGQTATILAFNPTVLQAAYDLTADDARALAATQGILLA